MPAAVSTVGKLMNLVIILVASRLAEADRKLSILLIEQGINNYNIPEVGKARNAKPKRQKIIINECLETTPPCSVPEESASQEQDGIVLAG